MMTAQRLMDFLQSERGAEVRIDGKEIHGIEMTYGKPINIRSVPTPWWKLLRQKVKR